MTHRTNWTELGPADPIPGDAPSIRTAAEQHKKIYNALVSAREKLTGILSGDLDSGMQAQSIDAIRDDIQTVNSSLQTISRRYDVMARELTAYAEKLDQAQTLADQAETDACNATNAINEATKSINSYSDRLKELNTTKWKDDHYCGDPAKAPTAAKMASTTQSLIYYTRLFEDAQDDKTKAENARKAGVEKLAKAVKIRNDAATAAADAIRAVIDNDGQNDNPIEQVFYAICEFGLSIVQNLWDALADTFEAIKKMALALGNLMTDMEKILGALLTNDKEKLHQAWNSAGEHLLDYLESWSDLTSGLGDILGTIGAILTIIPPLSHIGVGLSALSLGLKGLSLIFDAVLAQTGRTSNSELAMKAVGVLVSCALILLPAAINKSSRLKAAGVNTGIVSGGIETSTDVFGFFQAGSIVPVAKLWNALDLGPNISTKAFPTQPHPYRDENVNFSAPQFVPADMVFQPVGNYKATLTVVAGFGEMGRAYFSNGSNMIEDWKTKLNKVSPY